MVRLPSPSFYLGWWSFLKWRYIPKKTISHSHHGLCWQGRSEPASVGQTDEYIHCNIMQYIESILHIDKYIYICVCVLCPRVRCIFVRMCASKLNYPGVRELSIHCISFQPSSNYGWISCYIQNKQEPQLMPGPKRYWSSSPLPAARAELLICCLPMMQPWLPDDLRVLTACCEEWRWTSEKAMRKWREEQGFTCFWAHPTGFILFSLPGARVRARARHLRVYIKVLKAHAMSNRINYLWEPYIEGMVILPWGNADFLGVQ